VCPFVFYCVDSGHQDLYSFPTRRSSDLKYEKTPAQIVIRWHMERDVVAIPKSVTPSRIKENSDVFNFSLDQEDIHEISQLDCNGRLGKNPDSNDFNF